MVEQQVQPGLRNGRGAGFGGVQEQGEIQVASIFGAKAHFPLRIRHKYAQKHVKGEDVVFVRDMYSDSAHDLGSKFFNLYCLCDGHQGAEAAQFVQDCLWDIVNHYMPDTPPPPTFSNAEGMKYAEKVRRALTQAFVEIDSQWARQLKISGCTVTVAVVTGELLTVANVGDSRALLVCTDCVVSMTVDHRVQDNKNEKQRLKLAGAHVAPIAMTLQGPASNQDPGVGPLRVWPGGLCVSRSVGDIDVGPIILPAPHIKQVTLPEQGARLILASDGLWDSVSSERVARLSRQYSVESVCDMLIKQCLAIRLGLLSDDTSVLAVDFVPEGEESFPAIIKKQGKRTKQQQPKSLFCFFCANVSAQVSDDDVWTDTSSANNAKVVSKNLVLAEEDTSVHYCPVKGLSNEFVRVPLKNQPKEEPRRASQAQGQGQGQGMGQARLPRPKVRITKGSLQRVDAYLQQNNTDDTNNDPQGLSFLQSNTQQQQQDEVDVQQNLQQQQEVSYSDSHTVGTRQSGVYKTQQVNDENVDALQPQQQQVLHQRRSPWLQTQSAGPALEMLREDNTPKSQTLVSDTQPNIYLNLPNDDPPPNQNTGGVEGAVHGNKLYSAIWKRDSTAYNGGQYLEMQHLAQQQSQFEQGEEEQAFEIEAVQIEAQDQGEKAEEAEKGQEGTQELEEGNLEEVMNEIQNDDQLPLVRQEVESIQKSPREDDGIYQDDYNIVEQNTVGMYYLTTQTTQIQQIV
eukprot:TRINITY_DN3705_c0_g2_i1.p1 TRINITY_DN3705_c0_g2~~TRINITY_DN3705_c0_g2_i1.p1  ORF type:complete len:738 (-),score=118.39 TRINITY_DN3705_c0_g2_i1:1192-3405(-)